MSLQWGHFGNFFFLFTCVLCETLLLVLIILLLIFALCDLFVCFLNGRWSNCKRTFVFRCSGLFYLQVNIWFRALNKILRHSWMIFICLCNLITVQMQPWVVGPVKSPDWWAWGMASFDWQVGAVGGAVFCATPGLWKLWSTPTARRVERRLER